MKRKFSTVSLIILLFVLTIFFYGWFRNRENFLEINDPRALPMLKHFSSESDGGNISARDGRLLYDIIADQGYQHGLEIGTSNGYSALWQGLAFRRNHGKLITVEIDSLIAREAKKNFIMAGLEDVIDIRINDAWMEVPALRDSVDFVFIDTGIGSLDFFDLVYPFVKWDGTIVVHNVIRNNKKLKTIINNPTLESRFESRLFYRILIVMKKK